MASGNDGATACAESTAEATPAACGAKPWPRVLHPGHLAGRSVRTVVADVDLRAGDQLADLTGRTPAPGADGVAHRAAGPPRFAPPGTTRAIDDLLDALVTEGKGVCDFAERATSQVQPPDRGVIFRAREESPAIGLAQVRSGPSRPLEQVGIERHTRMSIITRLISLHKLDKCAWGELAAPGAPTLRSSPT